MSSTDFEARLNDSSKSTKVFLSYFHQAITGLAPLNPLELEDDARTLENPTVNSFSRTLTAGLQTLIKEIVQDIRWFRDQNRSSALRLHNLRADVEKIQIETNDTNSWHQTLTIQNIQRNISEVSEVYGKEGMERLSRLQEKIVKFHQEFVTPAKRDINVKLISQDQKARHEEVKQIGYNNVEVPIGEPADLVTYCMTIGLAVVKPFVQTFFHKKIRASKDRVQAMRAETQVEKVKLKVVEVHEKKLRDTTGALRECSDALVTINDDFFGPVTEHAAQMVKAQRMQPARATDGLGEGLDTICSEFTNILSSQGNFDIQFDELLGQIESPGYGLIKSHATIQVEEFYHLTKDISRDIESLLSIDEVIHEDRQHDFIANVSKVTEEFAEMLSKLKKVFDLWCHHAKLGTEKTPYSLRKEAAAVIHGLLPFDQEIRQRTDKIKKILQKKHDKSHSKRLQKWQKHGDRVHNGSTWEGRPLATISDASEVVQKLNGMTSAVSMLSNEIMLPLTLSHGDEPGDFHLEGSGEEVLRAVPESTLTMISAVLSVESINLRNLASKCMVWTPKSTK